MSYNRLERQLAKFLDSAPGLRSAVKGGYQRVNYLLHGWRNAPVRLHPNATIERIPGTASAGDTYDGSCERFFGYFGISPWSNDGRHYLYHQWQARHGGVVNICVHDRLTGISRVLAASKAWNFQQGSMAQWLNRGEESRSPVVFNDCIGRCLGCRIITLEGEERSLPWPIQALHPNGMQALSLNYRRLARIRPEYGYDVEVENFTPDQPLPSDGIWRFDLQSGDSQLIISLQALTEIAPRAEMTDADHKVNHAIYSPGGGRFVFMHRWIGARGKFSRLYCAKSDGTELHLLLDHRMVSHYAWRDDDSLIVWARTPDGGDSYYIVDVSADIREACPAGMLDQFGDGHPSFSPDRQWIVTDTYPDRARMRRLLLYRPAAAQTIELGAFFSPWGYDGPERCDLHPRWSPDGQRISIDSAHEGIRGSYIVDVSRLLAAPTNDSFRVAP